MSYDLYFKAEAPILVAALKRHFEQRPHFDVSDNQADYDNPETGVHFMFDFYEPEKGEEPDDPLKGTQAALALNFNRPSAFALEAAIEAKELADAFHMQMVDPQADSELLPYSSDKFIGDYLTSAMRVTKGFQEHSEDIGKIILPKAELNRIWDWNYNKEQRYANLGTDLFLPTLMVFQIDGELKTTVVWGDAPPMLLPRVDMVLVLRSQTAPKTGFLWKRAQEVVELLTFDQFLTDFGEFFEETTQFGGTWAAKEENQAVMFTAMSQRPIGNAKPMQQLDDQLGLAQHHFSTVLDAEFFD